MEDLKKLAELSEGLRNLFRKARASGMKVRYEIAVEQNGKRYVFRDSETDKKKAASGQGLGAVAAKSRGR